MNKLVTWFQSLPKEVRLSTYAVAVGLLFLFLLSSVKFISAGESGIKFNRYSGKVHAGLNQGINFVNPITTKVKKYDLRMGVSDFVEIDGMSADNQTIKLHVTVNWKYQADKLTDIYQKIVGRVEDTVLFNIVNETVKASLGKVQINDIAKNREGLRKDMEQSLKARMAEYYVDVINLSVVNVDYSDEFEKAVEAKQVAQQKAQEAEYNKQAVIREAEGQAQSNRLLQSTVTPLVLKQKWIEKWNGELPKVTTGQGSSLMLNVGEVH